MSIFTRTFWTEASERAVKSAAQAAILVVGADQVNVLQLDWPNVVGFAAGGAVLSLLTSVASASKDGSPSLVRHDSAPLFPADEPGEHKRED